MFFFCHLPVLVPSVSKTQTRMSDIVLCLGLAGLPGPLPGDEDEWELGGTAAVSAVKFKEVATEFIP